MSSSVATAAAPPSNPTTVHTPANSSLFGGSRSVAGGAAAGSTLSPSPAAQFREIHKNTWLKRLTAEGKKITVGPKKSDRSWVVFCVHDDTEALLEGYAEPRQAASHSPEWVVSMQDTLHISHALIPNSHEFEFVVTLNHEVVRFHAMSWEIMQEWVETLRAKLREMKILSPRENLYTKLPEIRAPLLPTRDPTSPLPAPPPVPAALVPGTELVSGSVVQNAPEGGMAAVGETSENHVGRSVSATPTIPFTSCEVFANNTTATPHFAAMSNTLTQNLLNMLSDPISAYSEHLNGADDDRNLADDPDSSSSNPDSRLDDLNDDLLSAIVRKTSVQILKGSTAADAAADSDNSVRVDIVGSGSRSSADHLKNLSDLMQCEPLIPRPHTSRSLSAGAADKSRRLHAKLTTRRVAADSVQISPPTTSSSCNITAFAISETTPSGAPPTTITAASTAPLTNPKTNITIIQVSTDSDGADKESESEASTPLDAAAPPKLPLKTVSVPSANAAAEVFKFPDPLPKPGNQNEYKSNVQIIPSNVNSSTILVGGATTAVANQYSTPVKKCPSAPMPSSASGTASESTKVTTVHVAAAIYGTCYSTVPTTHLDNHTDIAPSSSSPKLPKKIILSANTSGVTSIAVNSGAGSTAAGSSNEINSSTADTDDGEVRQNIGKVHYEKVFLSSSIPIPDHQIHHEALHHPSRNSSRHIVSSPLSLSGAQATLAQSTAKSQPAPSAQKHQSQLQSKSGTAAAHGVPGHPLIRAPPTAAGGSPAVLRKRNADQVPPPRPPFLARGLTEAVITTRPSRRDFHYLRTTSSKTKSQIVNDGIGGGGSGGKVTNPPTQTPTNNNGEIVGLHVSVNRTRSESEQRRRSSSTSDARGTRGANNNEFSGSRAASGAPVSGCVGGNVSGSTVRVQLPPQPIRNVENAFGSNCIGGIGVSMSQPPINAAASPAAKRMTLREQQVIQLRREIMHPGGVRLQLRRKDCIGSIAWVDAFGAVWVAGWKQKEHPVLYNALHIGDQLLSIAGMTISSASEANKIIRNANTLFVEVLVRRIPFGRGYAIRREREGQCLGLIRDGNTSTIVDVVPNSLAARHGLPPKAQSCDGSTLTFWVLTEINGRPLNLFFKDTEIRDRLNSVGRDISILVQPSDLIAKLKKQLKSLRGYKDYLVQ